MGCRSPEPRAQPCLGVGGRVRMQVKGRQRRTQQRGFGTHHRADVRHGRPEAEFDVVEQGLVVGGQHAAAQDDFGVRGGGELKAAQDGQRHPRDLRREPFHQFGRDLVALVAGREDGRAEFAEAERGEVAVVEGGGDVGDRGEAEVVNHRRAQGCSRASAVLRPRRVPQRRRPYVDAAAPVPEIRPSAAKPVVRPSGATPTQLMPVPQTTPTPQGRLAPARRTA